MNSTLLSINENNNTANYFDDTTTSLHVQNVGDLLRIYQVKVEGLSANKCRYIEKECTNDKINVILLQETHIVQEGERSQITGFSLVAANFHNKFGLAMYVKDNLLPFVQVLPPENDFYIIVKIDEQIIVNVYKPPSLNLVEILTAITHCGEITTPIKMVLTS